MNKIVESKNNLQSNKAPVLPSSSPTQPSLKPKPVAKAVTVSNTGKPLAPKKLSSSSSAIALSSNSKTTPPPGAREKRAASPTKNLREGPPNASDRRVTRASETGVFAVPKAPVVPRNPRSHSHIERDVKGKWLPLPTPAKKARASMAPAAPPKAAPKSPTKLTAKATEALANTVAAAPQAEPEELPALDPAALARLTLAPAAVQHVVQLIDAAKRAGFTVDQVTPLL